MRGWAAAGLVAVVWGAGVGAEEASPACNAFTADAEYVKFTIDMTFEGTKIPLRVPFRYFEEDASTVIEGENSQQIFSIDIDSWKPVQLSKETSKDTEENRRIALVVIGDTDPLPAVYLRLFKINGRILDYVMAGRMEQSEFNGLKIIDFSPTRNQNERLYVALDAKTVKSVIQCVSLDRIDAETETGACVHNFRFGEIDVELAYNLAHLHRWREIQSDVTAFLTCATVPAP